MENSSDAFINIVERFDFYQGKVNLTYEELRKLYESFKKELNIGLEIHKENPTIYDPSLCSFKMLDSFVPTVATGDEKGVYYAIDFGGSYLRSVRVNLKGEGRIETDYNIYSLRSTEDSNFPKGLMDPLTSGNLLFDRLVKQTKIIMESHGDHTSATPLPVGFTCSFPCFQKDLNSSTLLHWTKEFETGNQTPASPVVGEDVGLLLNKAYTRNKVPGKVTAVINDTVGTLLSCAYQKPPSHPPCSIGLILGTGCNACYVEPNASSYGYKGQIINIEFGNFDKALPMTDVDFQIDYHSSSIGNQAFEKFVSGCYMGEMVRIAIIRILQCRTPVKAWVIDSLSSHDVSIIALDDKKSYTATSTLLKKVWGVELPHDICFIIHKIALAFLGRSAALAACAVAAIADHIWESKPGPITCGVDGSLYIKNVWYQKTMRENLEKLIGSRNKNLYLSPADDGSGKGAALIAAIADMHKTQ